MSNRKFKNIVTIGAIIIGCTIVALWLFLPLPFSPRTQPPVTSSELFLIRMDAEMDRMELLLALNTTAGFIEAQFPAARIRDLCLNANNVSDWKKWSAIVNDMHTWYVNLVVDGSATLKETLNALYTKYPFLKLENIETRSGTDNMLIGTLTDAPVWKTSSVTWQDMPGLSITRKFSGANAFILFEGEVILESKKEGPHSGSVRLVVNGNEYDVKEFRVTIPPSGISNPASMILTWAGELPAGNYTIKVQVKVSDPDTTLRSSGSGDTPRLILMK